MGVAAIILCPVQKRNRFLAQIEFCTGAAGNTNFLANLKQITHLCHVSDCSGGASAPLPWWKRWHGEETTKSSIEKVVTLSLLTHDAHSCLSTSLSLARPET
jgi:hypothetical protein